MERLARDHFIAMRSLAKSRWVQGQKFEWKFNRQWRAVTYSEVPWLDAVYRLIEVGLAEQVECCPACKRVVFQLTESGRAMVARMNDAPVCARADDASPEATKAQHTPSWINRMGQVLTARLRS